ncbi:MAG: metallophosphoesterase [Bacteroidales bacterium]|nr:metallophosphoesterase [Bacteroidales bacterium]
MKNYKLHIATCLLLVTAVSYGQDFTEILGRPEVTSVTLSLLAGQSSEFYWEYGTSPGHYPQQTDHIAAVKDVPAEVIFTDLMPDTRYYYRSRSRAAGSTGAFLAGPERSFHTCRSVGSAFSFAVEADPHLDTNSNPDAYLLTLQNIGDQQPDFMFDLGDTFMSEKLSKKTQEEVTARHVLYRPYFGSVCHSVPLYLVLGNHEGEQGWKLDGTSGSLPVMAANTRMRYYPNPLPDSFYSGNEKPEEFVGLRQNYYAMEWGDALFIVLDPYWYTTVKPGWGWTLGPEQYQWFSEVLAGSNARFRFVFCHQLVGGNGNDARGGAEYADFFELGGKNSDFTWGFDDNRPGWGRSIHQLMVDHHVNVFFHGHDHCYAKQDKDGVVYQEIPQPSARNISNFTGAQYGYVNGTFFPNRGFLLVTISDTTAKVEYIRTYLPSEEDATRKNGDVSHSYTLRSNVSGIGQDDTKTTLSVNLRCSPNPVSGNATLSFEVRQACRVQVCINEIFGKKIRVLVDKYLDKGRYSFSLSRSELPSGLCLCRLITDVGSETIKLVVQ